MAETTAVAIYRCTPFFLGLARGLIYITVLVWIAVVECSEFGPGQMAERDRVSWREDGWALKKDENMEGRKTHKMYFFLRAECLISRLPQLAKTRCSFVCQSVTDWLTCLLTYLLTGLLAELLTYLLTYWLDYLLSAKNGGQKSQ